MNLPPDLEKFHAGRRENDEWSRWSKESDAYFEELRKEAEERAAERKRLESLPPKYVIHTVHGTFAAKADWIESSSGLESLRRELGWRVRIEPFRWSGRNGIRARWQAAQELARHITKGMETFPAAHHVIVAHSHGGNVAFWALNDQKLARKMLGVATLATPFLNARPRSHETLIDIGTGFIAGLFVLWAVLFYSVYRGLGLSLWPWASLAGIAVSASLFLASWVFSRMEAYAQRVSQQMPATALVPEQVAIVRVQGDEASAAIAGVRLAGILADLLWSIVSAPLYKRLNRVLSAVDYLGVRSFDEKWRDQAIEQQLRIQELLGNERERKPEQLPLFARPSPPQFPQRERRYGLDFSTARLGKEPESYWQIIRQTTVQFIPMLILYLIQEGNLLERKVALISLLAYGLPAAFSVLTILIGLPFVLVISLSSLPCGWMMPLAGPYLDLVADSCPPGTWKVTQFAGHSEPKSLFHSEAHESYAVWSSLAQWIKDRTRAFEAGL